MNAKQIAAVFLASGFLASAQIPSPVIPNGVGVNIHFVTGATQDLDMIAAAGFKFVRMDFSWESTEPKKGQYDFSAFDELTANLEKRGMHAIYILDYVNGAYEESVDATHPFTHEAQKHTASPRHPESIAGFAKWAAAAAKHFHGHPIVWEIYNEPNGFFWKPKPDAKEYAALAVATAKAIHEAEPTATVVAPAMSTFDWPFFETLFKSGALEHLDAITVHPYRDPKQAPETAGPEYKRLHELIDRYAPAGKKKLPIFSGEWGYSTHKHGVSLDTQAAFAVRQHLFNLLNNVPLSIWYDWKNDGEDPNENEHNFGTVGYDLKPKPAYVALKKMVTELNGYKLERRIDQGIDKDYVLLFTSGKKHKLAIWTTGEKHTSDVKEYPLMKAVEFDAMPKYFVVN
jgi:polysaccharide biosynthesis protein PslG